MRKKIIIAVFIFATVLTAALLWPTASYDVSKVHPALRELTTPYRSVTTGYYLDGGSIGITIIDGNGRKLELALPISDDGRHYPKLFIGAVYKSKTGAVEVVFSDDTRKMLIVIIEQHRKQFGGDSEIALAYLRGAPKDYGRIISRAGVSFWRRWFK